jgi:membrane protease YdiL (CAAX protease family)
MRRHFGLIFFGVAGFVLLLLIYIVLKQGLQSFQPVSNLVTIWFPIALYFLLRWFYSAKHNIDLDKHLVCKNAAPILISILIGANILFGTLLCAVLADAVEHVNINLSMGQLLKSAFAGLFSVLWEELFFRAFLFLSFLILSRKLFISAILSSIIFTLPHLQAYPLPISWHIHVALLSGGVAFCYLYVVFKTLWAPITLHLVLNLSDTVFLISQSSAQAVLHETIQAGVTIVATAIIIKIIKTRTSDRELINRFISPVRMHEVFSRF